MADHIVDTHVHIWNFRKAKYAWLDGNASILNRNYELSELEAARKAAGVDGGVLVQAANNEEDSIWMLENAQASDWIAGVVGWLPLEDPAAVGRLLEEGYGGHPLFKGVRHLIHDEKDPRWLLQGNVLESLSLLASRGLPYDVVGVLPEHIDTVIQVAEKVPGLKMVFDHLNQPPIASRESFGKWGERMREAAGKDNFYIKISGLGTTSGNFEGWQAADLEPYIAYALELFGEDRAFLGGDWPVSLLAGSYGKTWEAYLSIIDRLSGVPGREKILSQNAVRFYKLAI
ncbi:MAG TPA: amidohydrolase family protein [Puia sp.]|jgi:L-fuconolactonase